MTHVSKLMSRKTTFSEDESDWGHVESMLSHLMERTMFKLRDSAMEGRRLTVKVRNSQFRTHTYNMTLLEPTCLDGVVREHIKPLIEQALREVSLVRLIGFQIGELTSGHHQLLLDDEGNAEQWEKAMEGVDSLRERFGFQALHTVKSISPGKVDDPPKPWRD